VPGVLLGGQGVPVHGVVFLFGFSVFGGVPFGFVPFGFVDSGFAIPGVPVGGAVFEAGGTRCGGFGFVASRGDDSGCDGHVWFCGFVVVGVGVWGVCAPVCPLCPGVRGAVDPGALAPGAVEPGADCATIQVALRDKTASNSNFLIDMVVMMPSKLTDWWLQLMPSVGRRVAHSKSGLCRRGRIQRWQEQ